MGRASNDGGRRRAGGVLVLYVAFAAVAVAANLALQRAVLSALPPPDGLAPALVAGTAAGLGVKYLLDRRWIFRSPPRGGLAEGGRFAAYAATGLATTALFWGAEIGAWLVLRTEAAREAGAVAGLAAGYALKYRLDRRFVFTAGRAP